jgi:hypothetical protein
MRRRNGTMGRTSRTAVALLAVLMLAAAGGPGAAVSSQAVHFVSYFRASGESGQRLSLWERLTFSLLLAGHGGPRGKNSSPAAECRRS